MTADDLLHFARESRETPLELPRKPRLSRVRSWLYEALCASDPTVLVLELVVLCYYVATPGIFQGKASGDGFFGFMHLPGLFLHGNLDLRATVPEWAPSFGAAATGRVANPCPIGPDLVWAPTYLLGILLQKLRILRGAATGTPPPRFGQAAVDFWMAGLGTLLYGAVGIAALFRLLRRYAGVAAARFAIWASVLATPLCFYLVTQPLYQHAPSFSTVALLMERWDALLGVGKPERAAAARLRDHALLGALCGLAMLMRIQEGVWLLLPGLTLLEGLVARLRARDWPGAWRTVGQGMVVLAATAVVFLPQLLLWRYFYGTFTVPQQPGHMRWSEPAIVETLFSLRAGLFPWVPVLYLAVAGLTVRPLRGLTLRLLPVLLMEFWVNASAWDYHGSWAFGPRRFTDAMAIFAVGLAALFLALRRRGLRVALYAAAGFFIAYNGLLMELVRTRTIKSSSAGAFPAAQWIEWAKGPAWLGRALTRIGYPFAQPAGYLYAALYRIPVSAPEGILGSYFLERDWKVRSLVTLPSVPLSRPSPYVFPEAAPDGGTQTRVLVPLYTREPLELRIAASALRPEQLTATWNGHPLSFAQKGPMLSVSLPAEWVHCRGYWNVLRLSAPPGVTLERLDVISVVPWWRIPSAR